MFRKEQDRQSLRFPTYLKAYYYLDGAKEGLAVCNIVNVSYGGVGVRLYSPAKMKRGTGIDFGLVYKWKPISVRGVFKWTRNIGKFYVGGIELTKALDVFTVIKCCYGNTGKSEQADPYDFFMRAFFHLKACFAGNRRMVKEMSHQEKVSCLLKDFTITASRKIEHLESRLHCISDDCNKMRIALNGVKTECNRLEQAEERLKKKIFCKEEFDHFIKTNRSLSPGDLKRGKLVNRCIINCLITEMCNGADDSSDAIA